MKKALRQPSMNSIEIYSPTFERLMTAVMILAFIIRPYLQYLNLHLITAEHSTSSAPSAH